MNKKTFALNGWLTAALGAVLLVMVLAKTFQPALQLHPLSIPGITAIVLVALLAESFHKEREAHCLILQPILAAVTFAVLPMAAGVVLPAEAWKVALTGGVVFAIAAFVFDSIVDRVDSGAAGRIALVLTAFGIFLASQCFAGMIL